MRKLVLRLIKFKCLEVWSFKHIYLRLFHFSVFSLHVALIEKIYHVVKIVSDNNILHLEVRKNTSCCTVSFLFSVFRDVVKNCVSCLIHYIDIPVTLSNKNLHRHRKKIQILNSMCKKTRVFYDQICMG